MKKAVVLVSGGLDSATALAVAKNQGYACYALSFNYDQRLNSELLAAQRVTKALGVVEHKILKLGIGELGGSALTDLTIDVPDFEIRDHIPVTYVPARNTVFLSIALGWAEILGTTDIFIGANIIDYSGYPDCRTEYFEAFERLANLATKAGVEENKRFKIHAPLIKLNKAEIIKLGTELGLDYSITVSCYRADAEGRACRTCDSCAHRKQGFAAANLTDPTHYQTHAAILEESL